MITSAASQALDPGQALDELRFQPVLDTRDALRFRLQRLIGAPIVIRAAGAILRTIAPVIVLRNNAVVSRYADVAYVLARDDVFTVAETNGVAMRRVQADFVLGMDRSPIHDREMAFLRSVLRQGDLPAIQQITDRAIRSYLQRPQRAGLVDASHFARVVASSVVAEYFGVPGPNLATLARWLRSIFWDVFLNVTEDEAVRRTALENARELRQYLLRLVAAKKKSPSPVDDVLSRMVQLQRTGSGLGLDDDGICRNISGLIVGAVDTTTTAVSNIVLTLIQRPEALEHTREEATRGNLEAVRAAAYEALRFRPQTTALLRTCHQDSQIAGKAVRKGQRVLILTLSGMFDPKAFPAPRVFRTDRDSKKYLHFGQGMHECLGRQINGIQISAVVAALAQLRGLRPASPVKFEGPFPDSVQLRFDGLN